MKNKFQRIIQVSFLLMLFLIVGLSLYNIHKINFAIRELNQANVNLGSKVDAVSADLRQIRINLNTKVDAVLKAFIAEKVEALTKDKTSEEEKVIALARWVSSNISNRFRTSDKLSSSHSENIFTFDDRFVNEKIIPNGIYLRFALRSGACTPRALIFIEMLKYVNIIARLYNICCFPIKENAHSCVQVYYSGNWHFFDVTYAGYFKKHDKILSFEDLMGIVKKGENHLKYLVSLPNSLDYWNILDSNLSSEQDILKIDNQERMKRAYSKETLLKTKNYGYFPCIGDKLNCRCND
jgi:hypothetical protein